MSNVTPLAVPQQHAPEVAQPRVVGLSIEEMKTIARAIAGSGYMDTIQKPEQAFVKILYGAELGIGPMAAIAGVHIVEGKPSLDASLVAARIKQSGRYDYKIRRTDDTGCTIEFFERGESLGTSSFLEADASRAQLLNKKNWQKYPRAMYRSRAMTEGARTFCPDVFNGAVYTPDELRDVTPEQVPAIAADPTPVAAASEPEAPKDAIAGATARLESQPDTQTIEHEETAAEPKADAKAEQSEAQGDDDARLTRWIAHQLAFNNFDEEVDDAELLQDLTSQVASKAPDPRVVYNWRDLRVEEKREFWRRLYKDVEDVKVDREFK